MGYVRMSGEQSIELGGVSETALIPLWGRVQAGLVDDCAVVDDSGSRLLCELDYDFSHLKDFSAKPSGRLLTLALESRTRECDWQIRSFLLGHEHGTVVNVGAGLDDPFERVDNGMATWYDIDSEEIVDLRRRAMGSAHSPRVHEIIGSVLDPDVLAKIPASPEGVLFVIQGVLMYFDQAEVALLISSISKRFGCEGVSVQMVFDSLSTTGGRFAAGAIARSGMQDAQIRWTLSDPRSLERMPALPRLAESYPMFSKTYICPAWGRGLCMAARLSDRVGAYRMNRVILPLPHPRHIHA